MNCKISCVPQCTVGCHRLAGTEEEDGTRLLGCEQALRTAGMDDTTAEETRKNENS